MLSIAKRVSITIFGLLGTLLMGASGAAAQKYTPPAPPLTSAPCKPTRKDPCPQPSSVLTAPTAADAHPFPGEPPANATDVHPADDHAFPGEPPLDPTKPVTQTDGTSVSPGDAAAAHPFPGEPEAASSSSSSSSDGGSSSSPGGGSPTSTGNNGTDPGRPALKDEGSTGSTRFQRKHLPKLEDKDHREEQDLEVSKYYASTGDFNAAYLRAKDAVATFDDDPEAHFLLAQAAAGLHKTEEANTEYKRYLLLDPQGLHVSAAQKALGQAVRK